MKLHGFFRSGTSHRLRIALNLKGLLPTQSPAILEWLEDRDPDPPLLPARS